MSNEQFAAAAAGEWAQSHKPVVAAVDGSERNRSAVAWAANEAAATGCELVLVTAIENRVLPTPHFSIRSQERHGREMLARVRDEVRRVVTDQEVVTELVAGSAVEALLDRARNARMVVVGKRGLGAFARVVVGSTSIALAGRAPVPVAIIPDTWRQDDHASAPIVVGIDPSQPDPHPLRIAFRRAHRLGVRLVAVHGWQAPPAYSWEADVVTGDTSQWEQETHAKFDKVVALWRERFPEVEVDTVHSHSHPAMAVLDAAEQAQLVVLGRHGDGKLGGFPFGSVTRAVLHYSTCPVMVVPAETA